MIRSLWILLFGCIFLSGCTAILSSDRPEAALMTDRRDSEDVLMDTALELRIKKKLQDRQWAHHSRIQVYSFNRHVLLLGQAEKPEHVESLSHMISKIEGVRKIYNEVTIGTPLSPLRRLQDSWITAKIKTALYSKPKVKPWRVQVITEDAIVYLIGIVKSQEEAVAVEVARTTDGVKKVVKIFEYHQSPNFSAETGS